MRKFTSYGPLNTQLHYYAPREHLLEQVYQQLIGEDPLQGGHYITVWAPRQTGKTWVMQEVLKRVQAHGGFEVAYVTLQPAKNRETLTEVFAILTAGLSEWFHRPFSQLQSWDDFAKLFTSAYFDKPLILVLDEFDALDELLINQFANEFRSIYSQRSSQNYLKSWEKSSFLHGLALIGVRGVLGIENTSGSPFNVQRSLHIPNLTLDETAGLFRWYSEESGQAVEPAVVEQTFAETQGQPGLTCWLGELLTETYNQRPDEPISNENFAEVYAAAVKVLPNNNILNIISKANQPAYKPIVLELFRTNSKIPFSYDNPIINFLYTNGVITWEQEGLTEYYVKFASPFVQKRLFNAFATTLFPILDRLYDPLADLSDTITERMLSLPKLLRYYEAYLQQNRATLFAEAPRRATDFRVYEAVYHFNLYMYLARVLADFGGRVTPEFPTGNGKVDLLVHHAGQLYGLEVKSFANLREYELARRQAANYAQQLGLAHITLALFLESVDDHNRRRLEQPYQDATTGIMVEPVVVCTGV
ncbi:MAG: AAA-like domain-containing protein [Caldilineaceae bacterium]